MDEVLVDELVQQLITNDITTGNGLTLIDTTYGDLVADVLDAIPQHRINDVVLYDVRDYLPVGLNLLAGQDTHAVADNLFGVFDSLFHLSEDAPQSAALFHACLLTLAMRGLTFAQISGLLEGGQLGASFRERYAHTIDHPQLREFWHRYEHTGGGFELINPIRQCILPLLQRPYLRASLAQPTGGIDFSEVLGQNKILLVPRVSGNPGTKLHELVGLLVVTKLREATQSRRNENQRDHVCYVAGGDHLHAPPTYASHGLTDAIRAASRERYGRDPNEVEKELQASYAANCGNLTPSKGVGHN